MGKPKQLGGGSVQSALRMSAEFWERAEGLMAHLARKRGAPVSRTDVLREALARGVADLEREREEEP